MGTIEDIIKVLDDRLIETGKPFLTLNQANNELIDKQLMTVSEKSDNQFKKLLEDRLIPNSSQTTSKPKQWRIFLSDDGKNRLKELEPKPKKTEMKRKNNEWEPKKESNKFFYWAIGIFMVVTMVIVGIAQSNKGSSSDPMIKDLKDKYVGRTYNEYVAEELMDKYGYPETLNGTDNNYWYAYFPEGNFTLVERKGSYRIIDFKKGRKPGY